MIDELYDLGLQDAAEFLVLGQSPQSGAPQNGATQSGDKGSTDLALEGSTESQGSHRAQAPTTSGTPFLSGGLNLLGADKATHDGAEEHVETPEQELPEAYTELERYILATCTRQKSIPETYRRKFNTPVLGDDHKHPVSTMTGDPVPDESLG
jgi:hypothetical protein